MEVLCELNRTLAALLRFAEIALTGNDPTFILDLTTHAESHMVERNLTISDARQLLKNGHV